MRVGPVLIALTITCLLIGLAVAATNLVSVGRAANDVKEEPRRSFSENSPSSTSTEETTDRGGASGEPAPPGDAESAVDSPPFLLNAKFENQPCTDEYVVLLASADDDASYVSELSAGIKGVPGAKFLRAADSCSAFIRRDPIEGDLIYNAYAGPYDSLPNACAALDSIPNDLAWVRKLANPAKEKELCMCLTDHSVLPAIGAPGVDVKSLPARRLISQVQWILFNLGLNDRDRVFGNYQRAFVDQVRAFQGSVGLPQGGLLGSATWERLQATYCGDDQFLKHR